MLLSTIVPDLTGTSPTSLLSPPSDCEADHDDSAPVRSPTAPRFELTPPAVNQVVLSLYREGRDLELPSFQAWALAQVRSVIGFDSAWWGDAGLAANPIYGSQLFNCDAAILDDYRARIEGMADRQGMEACWDGDFFRAAWMANPGTSINLSDLCTRERYVNTDLYRKVGRKFRMEWSLGTRLTGPNPSHSEFLMLWRHDAQRPFTEAERQAKQLLMPHLVEGFRAVRLRHFLGGKDTRPKVWALADDQGFIRELSPAFAAALRSHWPDWHGSLLPEALARCVAEGQAFQAKTVAINVRPNNNLRFLEVEARSPLDGLTAREGEIVVRYARGETHSGIAAVLALSPTTVRNHISHSFKKLGVKNKAELANLMSNNRRAGI